MEEIYKISCNLSISRDRRIGYSARNIRIYLDGTVLNLGNGKTVNIDIASGKHNIGFAIGNAIATEIDLQIEDGIDSAGVICWVEANGGIPVRLTDYNIPHTISERDTLGKAANRAVFGALSVIVTLLAVGLVCTFLFLLRFL